MSIYIAEIKYYPYKNGEREQEVKVFKNVRNALLCLNDTYNIPLVARPMYREGGIRLRAQHKTEKVCGMLDYIELYPAEIQ